MTNEAFHNTFAIANNVDPSWGEITLQLPVVPVGDGYTIIATNIGNIDDVYASSAGFAVAPATSTSASSQASTTSGVSSGVSTGITVYVLLPLSQGGVCVLILKLQDHLPVDDVELRPHRVELGLGLLVRLAFVDRLFLWLVGELDAVQRRRQRRCGPPHARDWHRRRGLRCRGRASLPLRDPPPFVRGSGVFLARSPNIVMGL